MSSEQYFRPGVRDAVPLPPDFIRPPFLGYLSPLIEGSLLELVNTSRVEHPRHLHEDRMRLERDRYVCLESLFKFWKARSHTEAERTVRQASEAGMPFCLYLRNFDLGTKAALTSLYDEIGNPIIVSSTFQGDRIMQELLKRIAQPAMPVVSFENQAGDPGEINHFRVRPEHWEGLAGTLIRHAGVIVLFFIELTPSVKQELALIRLAGKQSHSLIVFGTKDEPGYEMLFGVKGAQAREIRGADLRAEFPDFPVQVEVSNTDVLSEAEAGLSALLQNPAAPISEPIGPIPPELMPPAEAIQVARAMALREYDEATKFLSQERFEDAEDSLIRSICLSFWGSDDVGRMAGMMTLAGLLHRRLKILGAAQVVFDLGLNLCESLRGQSKLAREYYPAFVEYAAQFHEECGGHSYAAQLRSKLEQTSHDPQ